MEATEGTGSLGTGAASSHVGERDQTLKEKVVFLTTETSPSTLNVMHFLRIKMNAKN